MLSFERRKEFPLPTEYRGSEGASELPERGQGQSPRRKWISMLFMRHRMFLVETFQTQTHGRSLSGATGVKPPMSRSDRKKLSTYKLDFMMLGLRAHAGNKMKAT